MVDPRDLATIREVIVLLEFASLYDVQPLVVLHALVERLDNCKRSAPNGSNFRKLPKDVREDVLALANRLQA